MTVFFNSVKKAGMTFAVGSSFSTARTGQKLTEPEGNKITVPYPNALFITFFNTGSDGELEFTYSYEDREPEDAIDFAGVLFELEVVEVVKTDADLTVIYASATLLGILIAVVIVCICVTLRQERQAHEENIVTRKQGAAAWGTRMPRPGSIAIDDSPDTSRMQNQVVIGFEGHVNQGHPRGNNYKV